MTSRRPRLALSRYLGELSKQGRSEEPCELQRLGFPASLPYPPFPSSSCAPGATLPVLLSWEASYPPVRQSSGLRYVALQIRELCVCVCVCVCVYACACVYVRERERRMHGVLPQPLPIPLAQDAPHPTSPQPGALHLADSSSCRSQLECHLRKAFTDPRTLYPTDTPFLLSQPRVLFSFP